MPRRLVLTALLTALFSSSASAQDSAAVCGPPPSPDVIKELNEKTKGDIEGKAQALSKYLGTGEIGGKIESERKTLYQTSNTSEATRNDRYLFYVTCMILISDKTASFKDKMDAIQALRKPISNTPSKSELMRQFLASVSRDTPREKVRELLGVPSARTQVSVGEGKKTRSYVMERYEGEYAHVFVIGGSPLRAIAVYFIKDDPPPDGTLPVPYYVIGNNSGGTSDGLGIMTLEELKEACHGTLDEPDARFFYLTTPVCYFGRGGGYNSFVFGFDAGEAVKSCKMNDAFKLKGMNFQTINCIDFWRTRPNFVLTWIPTQSDGDDQAQSLAHSVLGEIYWRL